MEFKWGVLGNYIDSISERGYENLDEVILVNTSDIFNGEVLNNKKVKNENLKGQFKKSFKNGDILFSEIRPANKRFARINFDSKLYIASTKLMVLRNKSDAILTDYIYYFLTSDETLRYLQDQAESRSGTFPQITFNNICELKIRVPEINEQINVVDILKNLDSKIEINNKIISNLESQAQAIFKSWFVDFEPFQDGDFVESELGMIPEGWKVKELGEVADFSNGYSFKSKDLLEEKKSKNDYKVFKQADIKVGGGINPNNTKSWIDSEFIRKNKLSRFIIQSGDLMMCMTDMKNNVRLLGNTALVYQPDEYILNQRVGRLRSKQKEIKPSFLYYLTNNSVFLNDLRGRANTGVQVNLSTSEIKRSKVILPTCDIIKRFCDYSESITKSINSLNNQNTKLAELRDALLPKLMAGEIDVSNIKIEGEEVKNE